MWRSLLAVSLRVLFFRVTSHHTKHTRIRTYFYAHLHTLAFYAEKNVFFPRRIWCGVEHTLFCGHCFVISQAMRHAYYIRTRARSSFFPLFYPLFSPSPLLAVVVVFFCFLTVSFTATKWEMAENEAENKNHIKWIIKIATIKKDSGVFSLSLFCLSHSLPGRYAQYSNVVFCTCAWPLNYFFLCACGVFLFV